MLDFRTPCDILLFHSERKYIFQLQPSITLISNLDCGPILGLAQIQLPVVHFKLSGEKVF